MVSAAPACLSAFSWPSSAPSVLLALSYSSAPFYLHLNFQHGMACMLSCSLLQALPLILSLSLLFSLSSLLLSHAHAWLVCGMCVCVCLRVPSLLPSSPYTSLSPLSFLLPDAPPSSLPLPSLTTWRRRDTKTFCAWHAPLPSFALPCILHSLLLLCPQPTMTSPSHTSLSETFIIIETLIALVISSSSSPLFRRRGRGKEVS